MANQPYQLRYSYDTDQFTGELALQYPEGVIYPNHTQTAALDLSLGPHREVGASAMIYIVANGDAITVPSDWVLYGDSISTVSGDTNILVVTYMGADKIHYSNKVIPA